MDLDQDGLLANFCGITGADQVRCATHCRCRLPKRHHVVALHRRAHGGRWRRAVGTWSPASDCTLRPRTPALEAVATQHHPGWPAMAT
jgi:hypothetical protein